MKHSVSPVHVGAYHPCSQTPKFVMTKNINELTIAKPAEQRICFFGFRFNFFSEKAQSPINKNELHVNMKIDELPIIKSETIIVKSETTTAARKPIVTAAKTLAAVINSRLGAKL